MVLINPGHAIQSFHKGHVVGKKVRHGAAGDIFPSRGTANLLNVVTEIADIVDVNTHAECFGSQHNRRFAGAERLESSVLFCFSNGGTGIIQISSGEYSSFFTRDIFIREGLYTFFYIAGN